MSKKALVEAVSRVLAENFDKAPIYGANEIVSTPDDASAYILVQYPYNSSVRRTFGAPGANIYREEGGIRFVIHIPRAVGISEGLGWADEIAALFRGREFDRAQTFAPTSPVLDDDNDRAGYFLMSFVVPYQLDVFG